MFATGSSARPATSGSAGRTHRRGRRVALAAVGLATAVSLSGCSGSFTNTVGKAFDGFGFPQGGITIQSHRVYSLWIGSVVAAFAVGFLVWGLIGWSVIRYRKRSEELPPQTKYNLPIEVLYTVMPFLIVSVLFFYTSKTEVFVDKLTPNPQVTVDVTAFQWNWEFSYPDAKGSDGKAVSTIGTTSYIPVLVVPTNERVRFVEHSLDVVHSFWVPDLLFKRDVFPGNITNQFQVTIVKTGAYVGHCAELCGTYHSMMNFELRAVSPSDFTKFIAAKKAGMSTPAALASIGQPPLAITTFPFNTATGNPA